TPVAASLDASGVAGHEAGLLLCRPPFRVRWLTPRPFLGSPWRYRRQALEPPLQIDSKDEGSLRALDGAQLASADSLINARPPDARNFASFNDAVCEWIHDLTVLTLRPRKSRRPRPHLCGSMVKVIRSETHCHLQIRAIQIICTQNCANP